jgi:O-antigen ligase
MNADVSKHNNDKIDDIILWIIFFFLAFMIFSTFLVQTTVIILLLAYFVRIITRRKLSYFHTPLDIPFLVFILARSCAIIFSTDASLSLASWNKEIFFYVTFFLCTNLLYDKEKASIKLLFRLLIIAAVIASIYGTTKVLLGIEERATSTTSGYYTLGVYLTVVFSITLGLGRSKEFFPSRILWPVILIIIFIGIIFTQNRIHWGIAALVLLFVGVMRERLLLVTAAAVGAAIVFLVPSLTERFLETLHFTEHLSDRDVLWQGAFMIILVHPFLGFGTRTFRSIFPLIDSLTDKGIGSWHSDFLQMYFEGGVINLAAFLWVMVCIFYYGIKSVKDKLTSKFNKDLLFAVLLGISVFYMTALVGEFILDPISTLFFQFLLAIASIIIAKGNAFE